MVQQHLEDGELGHVIGHARFVGGGLGLVDRQTRNTGFGHGVSTNACATAPSAISAH